MLAEVGQRLGGKALHLRPRGWTGFPVERVALNALSCPPEGSRSTNAASYSHSRRDL